MLHHRLLTPSRYSRPSASISVQPRARWMISGSYSAICVKGCQTWSPSHRLKSSKLGEEDIRVQGSRFKVRNSTLNFELETLNCLRSPLHNHFFLQPHAEHRLGTVADNRQLQKAAGSEN